MALGLFREEDKSQLQVSRVIVPQRGGKQLRLKVKKKEILIELSVSDVLELGDIGPGDWVEVILHSLVEHAEPGLPNKYKVESGWANGNVEGRVDKLIGGRWNGIVYHMGKGLKTYVDMDMDSNVDCSEIRNGEWWRFEFALPHQCMVIRKV